MQLCESVGLKNSWKVETGIALSSIVVLKCLINSMESYSLEYKGDDIRNYEEKRISHRKTSREYAVVDWMEKHTE